MAGSPHLSRRDFVLLMTSAVGTVMGLVIGLPVIGYLIDPALKTRKADAWIPLGPLDRFEIGRPTLVSFTRTKINGWEKTATSYGVFVLRKSTADVLVLSNVCTHLSCRVNWNEARQEYICPCHDGQFGPDGEVRGGPPPRPLDKYAGDQLKVENGILSLHLVEG